MPAGYVCSHCGQAITPAQNRCPHCGAAIDWRKAVGRTSYIRHLPAARKRRRQRRAWGTGFLILLIVGATLILTQKNWRPDLRPGATATVAIGEKQTAASSPAPAPSPSPTPLLPDKTPSPPDNTPSPNSTPAPQPQPSPQPLHHPVQVFPGDATQPPGAAALDSPLPTPTASFSQTLLYTGYDGHYHIRAWPAGQTLLDDAMQPAMGPDGILAYRSTQAQRPGLFLLYPDASTRRITKGADDQWPRWGPGGQQLLFTSAQRSPDASPHLYLVDINTRRVEALGPGQHAHWARDGQIIFSGCQVGGRACGLWQLDTATLQRTPLTTIPDDSAPVQSPRGRYIAFMSSGRSNNWDLFLLDTQTNDLLPIAPHPAEDGLPAWSPDGKKIAFLSNRSGVWALYTWSLEDFSVTRRVAISAEIPNWQQAGLIWLP